MRDIGYRQMGQLFVMGFDGTSVDPQIRSLIEDYHLGSIILTAKNLKCADFPSLFFFSLFFFALHSLSSFKFFSLFRVL